MLKYYLNVEQQRIGQYNGVSDSVLSTTLYVPNKYIELNEEQIARIGKGSITYIITGVEIPKTLNQLKSEKLAELQSNYDTKISQGYYDATLEVTLRCDDYAVSKFHKLSTQADGSSKNNLPYWDISDVKHTATKQAVKGLLNRLGDYILELEEALNDKKTAIALAQNETELNNVNITF